jgi:DNA-binding transcriptional LysR family regulator
MGAGSLTGVVPTRPLQINFLRSPTCRRDLAIQSTADASHSLRPPPLIAHSAATTTVRRQCTRRRRRSGSRAGGGDPAAQHHFPDPDVHRRGRLAKHTDAVATLPLSIATVLAKDLDQIVKPPIRLPRIEIFQYWHDRFHRDPGNQWIRSIFGELFRKATPS